MSFRTHLQLFMLEIIEIDVNLTNLDRIYEELQRELKGT